MTTDATKAGKRHSSTDEKKIQTIHDEIVALGAACGVELDGDGTKTLVAPPTTGLKALGDGKVGGYLVLFSDATKTDLTGDYFDKDTDYDISDGAGTAVYYHHGLDPVLKARKLGTGTLRKDDIGVWLDAQLAMRDEYERAVYGMVEAGKCGLSSGTAVHLVERVPAGKAYRITRWPLGLDASITPTPAEPRTRVLPLKSYIADLPAQEATSEVLGKSTAGRDAAGREVIAQETHDMTPEEVQAAIKAALDAERTRVAAEAAAAKEQQDKIDAAVKAAEAEWAAKYTAGRRLPSGDGPSVPYATKFHEVSRFDDLDAADMSILVGILDGAKREGRSDGPSETALKALAIKMHEDKSKIGHHGRTAMKAAGLGAIKADEIMQTDLTGFGLQWVGDAFGTTLWESIRDEARIVARIPSIEFPAGADSLTWPLEGTDPTFYKVPEAADTNATSGIPNATVPLSQISTINKTMTLSKMGARVQWTGELNEDSMFPFAAELRRKLTVSGAEQLEHAIIDGDTATAATTNINHIGGTPGSTDLYLMFDGFRKLPLVTNTANSRSGGSLTSGDFTATVQLMGTQGLAGLDQNRISFIVSPSVHWLALELTDVKTRDVFAAATLENGMLSAIYGYEVLRSGHMHYKSATRLANTAGKVDQTTTANNTTGSILAVRWDQWRLGWRRRMTIETERIARADAYEIVALARVGLAYRDTEASAISYNITA